MEGKSGGVTVITCVGLTIIIAVCYIFHCYTDDPHTAILSEMIYSPRFVQNDSTCSVGLQTTPVTLPAGPTCDWNLFNDYLLKTQSFYGEGVWWHNFTKYLEFYPKHCAWPNRLKTWRNVQQCFSRKKIFHILISGDSTYRLLAFQLISWLQSIGREHIEVKEQPLENDIRRYFNFSGIPFEMLQAKKDCCINYCYHIRFKDDPLLEVKVEFIPMLAILDGSIRLEYGGQDGFQSRTYSAESKLEYLLKYFFPNKGFPDVWIYGPAIHHEAWHHSAQDFEMDLLHALRLFEIYLPKTTQLVFKATTSECSTKRSPEISKVTGEFWNSTRNHQLEALNNVLARTLVPFVKKHENYKAFLDGMRLSCPLQCILHNDGAHMIAAWYQALARYAMEMFCHD